ISRGGVVGAAYVEVEVGGGTQEECAGLDTHSILGARKIDHLRLLGSEAERAGRKIEVAVGIERKNIRVAGAAGSSITHGEALRLVVWVRVVTDVDVQVGASGRAVDALDVELCIAVGTARVFEVHRTLNPHVRFGGELEIDGESALDLNVDSQCAGGEGRRRAAVLNRERAGRRVDGRCDGARVLAAAVGDGGSRLQEALVGPIPHDLAEGNEPVGSS